jgi:hypothetical protein
VPNIDHHTLKHEVKQLCSLGVLNRCSDSEWAAHTFMLPKNNGTVRLISDFRKLNEQLKIKPYPIPKKSQMLQELEEFAYATYLDFYMA